MNHNLSEDSPDSNNIKKWGEVKATIHLGKGNNVVRLYHDRDELPEIDCMTLTRK